MDNSGLWVVVKALARVQGQHEERYLLRKDNSRDHYQLLGNVGPVDGDPQEGASQMLEVQLGGIKVGWDLIVEPLERHESVQGVHPYQGFFVRPVWEFGYLWAGDVLRWFSVEELDQSTEVDQDLRQLLSETFATGRAALPRTLGMYLHGRYDAPFRTALAEMSSPDALVLRGIDSRHRAELGAILRRRLLAVGRDGPRVLNRVSIPKTAAEEVRLSLMWRSSTPTDPRATLLEGWQSLAQPSDEDLINGGGIVT